MPHDPSRLYQLTAGWEERRKQSSTQETADVFISARDVPRRWVEWSESLHLSTVLYCYLQIRCIEL